MSKENKNVQTDSMSDCINITVVGSGNSEMPFVIHKDAPLKLLMKPYCNRLGMLIAPERFKFKDDTIRDSDTAKSLKMEEGDIIRVL